ncbi:DUF7118 family protein [Natronobiforma cellulositropha]|uniref:DUF7118 family protein n=1 Tax=Natronobiforma cellulositropha TaxID=1679076 RepID=UPI0021D570EC|nr:hypothetical protein [Natronobiforma cellulositropha]
MGESLQYHDDDSEHPLERLERARDRLETVERRIDDLGGTEQVERGGETYDTAATLLERYVDRATGTGRSTFAAYVELEGHFSTLVENLPADLPHREAFEAAFDAIDKRRLNESDFERAEDALEPASVFRSVLDDREAAREAITDARTAATERLRALETEISAAERTLKLGETDLDAPVERLREPIDRYNAAIEEAFTAYVHERSARALFSLLERSRLYPFVPFERPPADLRAYVFENEAGTNTVPTLLEYASYSHSKLDHYVDDAAELKRRVATQQTYLEGIDATALSLEWPPDDAVSLRIRLRERQPFVARVADESTVALLREIRRLTYDDEYERLQTAAAARSQLTPDERERLADGRVAARLESLRAEHERLRGALESETPR